MELKKENSYLNDACAELEAQLAAEAWNRRAPVVPTEITYEMSDAGLNAYNQCTSPFRRTKLAAAPQPQEATIKQQLTVEAAPVQLPEPVAKIEGGSLKWHIPDTGYSLPVRYLQGTQMLYTEQQVMQLLAAHGITLEK